jgi:hypothetical protein
VIILARLRSAPLSAVSLEYLFGFSIDGERGLELTRMTLSTLSVAIAICSSQQQSGHWQLAATGRK